MKRILKWTLRAILAVLALAFLVGFIAYWWSTNECDRNVAVPVNRMKAVRFCEYGVVTFADVEKPVPKDNQVLIKVRASSGQTLGRIVGNFTDSWFSSSGDQKFVRYITKLNKEDIALLGDLLETGKIRPVIERTSKLSDAPEALRLFNQGHARGKTVITME